ncbi:YdcF family protein [Gallibacterium trehalosifermentans]|uniref:YdcF family protein n=1 Tax=Gallibacterium trehalosifermentans TaxID=516935 RepID=A0ABV6GYT3_9PAST
MFAVILKKVIEAAILPPFNLILFGLLAFILLFTRWQKTAKTLLAGSLLLAYLISTPFFSDLLLRHIALERPNPAIYTQGQVIVVLGGGLRYSDYPESYSTTAALPLERMRYAVYLQQKTGLPIAISGGVDNEAKVMGSELQRFFQIEAAWLDNKSNTTEQNAIYLRKLFDQTAAGKAIQRVILVTNEWHMRRAVAAFQRQGFDVLPAPTLSQRASSSGLLNFIPQPVSFYQSGLVLREWLGLLRDKLIGL